MKYFDNIYPETQFVDMTHKALSDFGFSADNTIACAGVCRDEISQSLVESVNSVWGYAFNLSSLAGMLTAGKTGLLAAMHHAPNTDNKERYVFYTLTHIAIDEEEHIGICKRSGRKGESTACGALNAFQKEIAGGKVNSEIDLSDAELSLIRMRLLKEIPDGEVPDLLEITKMAQKAIQEDLELALAGIVDTGSSDYAVITGIQIHRPDGNYIWPASCYAVISGVRQELELRQS